MVSPSTSLLLLLASGVNAACNVDDHHPENGGYYIEGIAGIIPDSGDSTTGRRADNTTWAPNTYYPHGEMKLCEGMFCSDESRVNGTAQYVVAHTCGLAFISGLALSVSLELT